MRQPAEIINQHIEGFRTTVLIATAVRLRIIDALKGEPRLSRELAASLNLDEKALSRFLRGLAVLDLVEEHSDPGGSAPRYGLTSTGNLLRSDAEGSPARYALLCQEQYLPAWTKLEAALREGRNPFESAFGQPVWQYRQDHPEAGKLFNEWLHAQSSTVVDDIVAALDFSSAQKIADIAGGVGTVLSHILRKFSDSRGVLAERPSVLQRAAEFMRQCELQDRCDLAPIDFFVAVPAGCDVYLLKSILHDWNDSDCVRILGSLSKAMSSASRLYIIERILPSRAQDDPETIWVDLMMMNVTGGRERTLREYESLLERADLSLVRLISTASRFRIMEVSRR